MKKGQYIRLLLSPSGSDKVIAAAKTMALHGSATTEEVSTKDTTGNATEHQINMLSYDLSGSALVITDNDSEATGALTLDDFIQQFGSDLDWKICIMEGEKQRTVVGTIARGTASITNLSIQAQNGQTTQYSYTLNGKGAITPSMAGFTISSDSTLTFPTTNAAISVADPALFIKFNEPVSRNVLLKFMKIYKQIDETTDEAVTLEASASLDAINVKDGEDYMFVLTPNDDHTVWTASSDASSTPTWTRIEFV